MALLLVPRRAWLLLALAAVPLTYLQVHDAITDLEHGERRQHGRVLPAADPLPRGATGRGEHIWRVEVPFTAGHWEAYWLAPVCRSRAAGSASSTSPTTGCSTDGRLTAGSYDAWLHRLAVRYVAVADAPADYSARGELRLIRRRASVPASWSRGCAHWRVYAVAKPSPIATGAGRLVSMGPNSLTLAIAHRGQRPRARALVAVLAAQRRARVRRAVRVSSP